MTATASADVEALYELTGDIGDELDVRVQMQDRQCGQLSGHGDDQVWDWTVRGVGPCRSGARVPRLPVLGRRGQVLHRHAATVVRAQT